MIFVKYYCWFKNVQTTSTLQGLFATKKIPPKTLIVDYHGEIHVDAREESDYDLSLFRTYDGVNIGVDAAKAGSEARFINDWRGVRSSGPNAVFKDGRTPEGRLQMSIWSGHNAIQKGEEVVVSYGKSWWKARAGVATEADGEETSE